MTRQMLYLTFFTFAIITLGFPSAGWTAAAQTEPVTLYATGETIYSIDPQLVQDEDSLEVVENLFLGLTDIDPKTSAIRPEIATKWNTNKADDIWTFELRTDVPWVRWDPATKQVAELRKVVAADFEYGIKRSCDPRLGAVYTQVAARLIKGCNAVAHLSPANIKETDFDAIGVKALNDHQLQIQTPGVLPYFLSTSSMWMFRAVPKEIIAQYGPSWTNVGLIVTNGPYVMDENVPERRRVFLKNPLYPANVNDNYNGNVERLIFSLGCGNCQYFDQYVANQIDTVRVGGDLIDQIRADPELSKQYVQRKKLSVEYLVFNYDKPPFNNVHVRRAFSAVIDRKAFTDVFLKGTSYPIDHFIPPGATGAVPLTQAFIGKAADPGFDPAFAKKELAAAGFPNCKGFPVVTMLVIQAYQGQHIQAAAAQYLGCDPSRINIVAVDYGAMTQLTGRNTPRDQRPNLFVNIWGADYPDAQNFMGDVLGCNAINASNRPCGPLDTKITAASMELRPVQRAKLYADLEAAMFGPKGEFPIAPIRIPTAPFLVKPWYQGFFETDGLFAGKHWNTRRIDQKAQLAARAGIK